MKKILLTTSALTLLAGAAAADVNLSGYGRIGVASTDGVTAQYTRMNLDISGSSTTDGGLTMTIKTRYRSTTGDGGVANMSSTGVFSGPQGSISNGTMGLTVGNAAGAVAQTAGVWGCGAVMWGCQDLTDDRWGSNWATRSSGGAGPDVIRLDMALGGASISVSGGNGNDTELAVSMPMGGGSIGIGYDTGNATDKVDVKQGTAAVYGADGVDVAAVAGVKAAAAADALPITQINYSGSVGDLGVGVRLAQQDGKNAYIASVSAPAGGGSVYVFAGRQLDTSDNYGLRYNMSLGGGASMHAGATNTAGITTVGAGVQFGF